GGPVASAGRRARALDARVLRLRRGRRHAARLRAGPGGRHGQGDDAVESGPHGHDVLAWCRRPDRHPRQATLAGAHRSRAYVHRRRAAGRRPPEGRRGGEAQGGGRQAWTSQAGRVRQEQGRLMSWFDRLRQGLSRTRDVIAEATTGETASTAPAGGNSAPRTAPSPSRPANWEMDWDELGFAPIGADVGGKLAAEVVEGAKRERERGMTFGEALEKALLDQLEPDTMRLKLRRVGFQLDVSRKIVEPKGNVIMVVGVNGVGKTTTIAKLGAYYQSNGRSVMFAAGDTFRAAGSAQLAVWGERLGVPTVTGPDASDPAAVAFDGAQRRRAQGKD